MSGVSVSTTLANTCGRRCSPVRYGRLCHATREAKRPEEGGVDRRRRYECCSFICSSTQVVCKGTDLLLFRCSRINDACKRSWPVIQFSSVRPIMSRDEGGERSSNATQVVFVHPRRSFMKSLASRCSGVSVSSTQVSGDMLWLHAVACAKPRGGRPRSDRQQDTDGWVFVGGVYPTRWDRVTEGLAQRPRATHVESSLLHRWWEDKG